MQPMTLAAVLWLAVSAGSAAGEAPSERLIVQMALLRMVERVDFLANASFGPSMVHPQPEGRYWAVVGEAVSGAVTGRLNRHVFVAAVRLTCEPVEEDACWQLEKLAIDDRIIVDLGQAL